jgi:DNA invertase Pin-like site-specific DNA recombinase
MRGRKPKVIDKNEVARLHQSGVKVSEIAKTCSVSVTKIYGVLKNSFGNEYSNKEQKQNYSSNKENSRKRLKEPIFDINEITIVPPKK